MRHIHGVVTLKLDTNTCIGCGECVRVCPHRVFELQRDKACIVRRDACIECGACANNCPVDALAVDAGVGCAAAMLDGLVRFGNPDKGTCDCTSGGGWC